MEKFDRLEAVAAPLPMANVDTDKIIPARFLKTIKRTGLGVHLFAGLRYQDDGIESPDFVLNRPKYRNAKILIAGENFGCGSSREHAPQALMRFGFNGFVGASFAEIFAGNCTALGLPCVTLSPGDLEALMESVELDPEQEVEVDLVARTVRSRAGTLQAGVHDGVRMALLEGTWHGTAVLLDAGDAIEARARSLPYVGGFQA